MSSSIKNIASILIFVTVAFGGYYLYVQRAGVSSDSQSQSEEAFQSTLAKTSVFIERSQELDRMMLDTSLLEDERFISLKSNATPVRDVPTGRPDPFAPVSLDGVE